MSDTKKVGIALTASEAFVRDLGKALSVPPQVLLEVANYVNTERGIVVPDTERLLEIWKASGLSPDDLSSTYGVLKHLFKEATNKKTSVEPLLREISEFCTERKIPGFEERKDALRAFLEPKPEYLKRKVFLDSAFDVVPQLTSINGTVQLKAAFADNDSCEIAGYVPIAQIMLVTDHAEIDKERVFVFQVDEPGLRKLLDGLKEYENQLLAVKNAVQGKIEVYTRPEKGKPK